MLPQLLPCQFLLASACLVPRYINSGQTTGFSLKPKWKHPDLHYHHNCLHFRLTSQTGGTSITAGHQQYTDEPGLQQQRRSSWSVRLYIQNMKEWVCETPNLSGAQKSWSCHWPAPWPTHPLKTGATPTAGLCEVLLSGQQVILVHHTAIQTSSNLGHTMCT